MTSSPPAPPGTNDQLSPIRSSRPFVTMPASREAWDRAAIKSGILAEDVGKISMRSLNLGGHRLATDERSVGVLIVESTTSARVTQAHLDLISESHLVGAIAELVASFVHMTPAGESFAPSAAIARSTAPNWQEAPARTIIGPPPQPLR